MTPHSSGGDHFTPIDRRELIETGVNLRNLRDDFAEMKKSLADGDNRFTTLVNQQQNRYEQLLSTQGTRLETLIGKVDAKVDAATKEHGERLSKLEQYKWWLMGAAAGSGTIAGLLGSRFFHP